MADCGQRRGVRRRGSGAHASAIRMASLGDTLADRIGRGEAICGAGFFGAARSLSGIVITAVAAAGDNPILAYSNAVGGIAATPRPCRRRPVLSTRQPRARRRVAVEHPVRLPARRAVDPRRARRVLAPGYRRGHPSHVRRTRRRVRRRPVALPMQRHPTDVESPTHRGTRLDQPAEEDTDGRSSRAVWAEFICEPLVRQTRHRADAELQRLVPGRDGVHLGTYYPGGPTAQCRAACDSAEPSIPTTTRCCLGQHLSALPRRRSPDRALGLRSAGRPLGPRDRPGMWRDALDDRSRAEPSRPSAHRWPPPPRPAGACSRMRPPEGSGHRAG